MNLTIFSRKYIVLATLVFLLPAVASQDINSTEKMLENAENSIKEMNNSGIPTQRVQDLYTKAERDFRIQKRLKREGEETDFSRVDELTNNIQELKELSFRVMDEINLLENQIKNLDNQSIDVKDAKNKLEAAKKEFRDGRFEESQQSIQEAYSEISKAQSGMARTRSIIEAKGKSITDFIEKNTIEILAALAVFTVVTVIFYHQFSIYKLKKRKEKLRLRREVLNNLIKETQRKYFQEGEISESSYNTRSKKYKDMMSEIDKEIPLIEKKIEQKTDIVKRLN